MSAHTPGPWSVPHFAEDGKCKCGYVLCESYMGAIATVHHSPTRSIEDGDNPPLDEAKANAHLIAAAPDMLAALEGIVSGCVNPDVAVRRVMLDLAPIRAAIAMATGKGNQ